MGFRILLKDTLTNGPLGPGIETATVGVQHVAKRSTLWDIILHNNIKTDINLVRMDDAQRLLTMETFRLDETTRSLSR